MQKKQEIQNKADQIKKIYQEYQTKVDQLQSKQNVVIKKLIEKLEKEKLDKLRNLLK